VKNVQCQGSRTGYSIQCPIGHSPPRVCEAAIESDGTESKEDVETKGCLDEIETESEDSEKESGDQN
jgi:hypothetical protein